MSFFFFLVSFNNVPRVVQGNHSEKISIDLVLNAEVLAGKENILYFSCKPLVAKIAALFVACLVLKL